MTKKEKKEKSKIQRWLRNSHENGNFDVTTRIKIVVVYNARRCFHKNVDVRLLSRVAIDQFVCIS